LQKIAALGEKNLTIRAEAARLLAVTGFGKRGKECVAALKPLLASPDESSDGSVHAAALQALKKADAGDIDPETAALMSQNPSEAEPDADP
jgi:hypothetical protein